MVLVCIYHLLGSQGFQNDRIHGECMNKTKLSFIPLLLMHGDRPEDVNKYIDYSKSTASLHDFFAGQTGLKMRDMIP